MRSYHGFQITISVYMHRVYEDEWDGETNRIFVILHLFHRTLDEHLKNGKVITKNYDSHHVWMNEYRSSNGWHLNNNAMVLGNMTFFISECSRFLSLSPSLYVCVRFTLSLGRLVGVARRIKFIYIPTDFIATMWLHCLRVYFFPLRLMLHTYSTRSTFAARWAREHIVPFSQ